MNPFRKIAVFVCIGFLSTSLVQRYVAAEDDQGMCPFSGEAAEDEPVGAKYQKPPEHADSQSKTDRQKKQKLPPDIEVREEINHPVLGKMKLVTVPVPNKHTGEEFTTGYILVKDEESNEESEDLMLEDDTPSERGKRRSEAFATAGYEEEILSEDDSWGRPYRASTINPIQRNSTGSRAPERMMAENTTTSPASQSSQWTKKCCTCGDPPEEECLREREECGCGDRGALQEAGEVKCTWRCCCC